VVWVAWITDVLAATGSGPWLRTEHLQEIAFLVTRYRSEFGMSAIPALVQRIIFPIQLLLGRLSGRFAKYADAPEPARR
jgi:hypothetical protein